MAGCVAGALAVREGGVGGAGAWLGGTVASGGCAVAVAVEEGDSGRAPVCAADGAPTEVCGGGDCGLSVMIA